MESGEHRRAWDRFQQVTFVHTAAIEAFRLLHALPHGAEQLGGSIQARYGFAANEQSARSMAEVLLQESQKEAASGFQTVRSSALIAICAAFEHLVKARFVDAALADKEQATRLLSTKKLGIKLDLAEVLGLPESEQWFVIAHELFKKGGDGGKPMSDRVRFMLFDYIDMHPVERTQRERELENQLRTATVERFNLAFLVRHCFVHNGGRVTRALSRSTKRPIGQEILLTNPDFKGLIAAVRVVAESASPYFLLSLE